MNVPKEKVNRLQCCNGCNKYLNKDNIKMCLLLLIYFQRLTDSNGGSADHGSFLPSFLPPCSCPSHFTARSKRTTNDRAGHGPSLSSDYILSSCIEQGPGPSFCSMPRESQSAGKTGPATVNSQAPLRPSRPRSFSPSQAFSPTRTKTARTSLNLELQCVSA